MWLDRIGDPADTRRLAGHFGAYRLITRDDVFARWNGDVSGDPRDVREDGVVEKLFEALAANDPLAGLHHPPAFRCPNGAFADLIEVFNGRPLYDPANDRRACPAGAGRTRHHLDRDRTCGGCKQRSARLKNRAWKYLAARISSVSRKIT